MKLNVNKWYKNPNLLGITTQNNKHLCNIFLPNLLQICDEYDVKNGTVVINDLLQLLDASYEVFDTKETKMFQNVKQNLEKFSYTELEQKIDKFYFQHRNVGLNPDKNNYYFSSVDELICQVELLQGYDKDSNFIRWSVTGASSFNKHQYTLINEYWSTESRGTDTPLKCYGWFVYGYIYDDMTTNSIFDVLPKFTANYVNQFIERRYISPEEFSKLSDVDKDICRKDGGIILNKHSW